MFPHPYVPTLLPLQVRPVRARVIAIGHFPTPITKKEFLGMAAYYYDFVRISPRQLHLLLSS